MDSRLELLHQWCCNVLPVSTQNSNNVSISMVAGDASFRRYFRVQHPALKQPLIAMDAPPGKEDIRPFVDIAVHWRHNNIPVPAIVEENEELGFLLLEDFSDTQLLSVVAKVNDNAQRPWYEKALNDLHRIQMLDTNIALPPYDAPLLQRELDLFTEWLLGKALNLNLNEREQGIIEKAKALLIESALEQPRVVVHRDYHSRNIMVLEDNSLGIIDFQDAAIGPATYDLVSLLRDCYIKLENDQVRKLVNAFHKASAVESIRDLAESVFWRHFDLMGIQRHMKASGIFARLALRDDKWSYIQDIPLTLDYIIQACAGHPDLKDFGEIVSLQVKPALLSFAQEHLRAPA